VYRGVDPGAFAILQGNADVDRHAGHLLIQTFYNGAVAFINHRPTHFAGPGEFVLVRVQILVKQCKSLDSGCFREFPVHPQELFFNKIGNLRLGGQVAVGRIGYFVVSGPFSDDAAVDADQGRQL
jgi:hypothetical protein